MVEALHPQEVAERYIPWGAALLFANVGIKSNNRVDTTLEQDPLGIIPLMPDGFPPPRATTGLWLGWIEDGTELDPGVGMQEENVQGLPAPISHLINAEKAVVRCGLQLSGIYEARKMVCYPPGISTGTGHKSGGMNKPVPANLFCIITNYLDPRMVLCRIYFQGVFQPGTWKIGYNRSAVPMQFLAEHGSKPNSTCLRNPGEGIQEEWYMERFTQTETIFVPPGMPIPELVPQGIQSDFGINSLNSNLGWGW